MNPDEASSQHPSLQPTGPQRSRKKMLFIVGGVVIVVAVIFAFIVFGGGNQQGSQPNGGSDNSLYYDRDGYNRKDLAPTIGDPFAITMAPDKSIIKKGDVAALPACSVLTLDDLKNAGFRAYANDFGFPIQQSYISDKGKAAFGANPNKALEGDATPNCNYGLASSSGKSQSVDILVNQPFVATSEAVVDIMESLDYKQNSELNSYKVFKRDRDPTNFGESYILQKNGTTIAIQFELNDSSKNLGLLQTAAKNIDAMTTKPVGHSIIAYKSPTFTQPVAKACDFVDNEDVKQLSGVDANALVQERWPTAVGIADFSRVSDYKTKTNYIRSQCVLTSNKEDSKVLVSVQHHSIRVTATTYENDQAAGQGMLHTTVGNNNQTKVKGHGVGDEAYLYKDRDGQNTLTFRQGRVVVELLYDFLQQADDPATADPNQYAAKLSPLGTKIAEQLKSQKY